MAHSRDAIDTLRGYYYQFDYFILKLAGMATQSIVGATATEKNNYNLLSIN